MSQKGIWATGAISFAFLGFILLSSPITQICGKEASPSQLFNLVGSGVTCTNKKIPIDLFLSSAQLAVGGPFVASVICLVLAFLYGPKRDWKNRVTHKIDETSCSYDALIPQLTGLISKVGCG